MDIEKAVAGINSEFEKYFSSFKAEKYPQKEYHDFKETFSSLLQQVDVTSALKWKWGHWGKARFPAKQAALIKEISNLWPRYVDWAKQDIRKPNETFSWWRTELGQSRYITIAYLTHLIHPSEAPIIDQHNFRAMNHFLEIKAAKKKPSSWDDVLQLKRFIDALKKSTGRSVEDIDKYLMVFGSKIKLRKCRKA